APGQRAATSTCRYVSAPATTTVPRASSRCGGTGAEDAYMQNWLYSVYVIYLVRPWRSSPSRGPGHVARAPAPGWRACRAPWPEPARDLQAPAGSARCRLGAGPPGRPATLLRDRATTAGGARP